MPALSWLMNLGFAGGGTVLRFIRRVMNPRSIVRSEGGTLLQRTEIIRIDEELVFIDHELVGID